MRKPILYIVIPCYNEEEVIEETSRRIIQVIEQMIAQDMIDASTRMLCVDDGSEDRTWELICRLHATTPYVCGVKLATNSGHQNALLAGLFTACSHADIMVSIDADLQDDVNAIPEMVRKYSEGNDIVYGVRRSRATDTWFKRNTALGFYKLMKMLGVKSVYNHADYRLMSRRAVEQLSEYRERNLFLRGMVPLIGYRSANVYFNREKRFAGESKYPLRKMLHFAVDGVTSFSIQPLRLLFFTGFVFILISIAIFIWVITRYFGNQVVPGWSSIILSIWFVGGTILMGMGVMGEYIGKMYIEVKDRPRYNIEAVLMDSSE